MNSFPNRKTARKEARLAKKTKKCTNYQNRKLAKKIEERNAYLDRNPHIKEKITTKRNEKHQPKPKRKTLQATPNFVVAEDPLLAFAERAIESGILGSDGEFDESKMNDLFVEKYSDSEIESDDNGASDSSEEDEITYNSDAENYLNGNESEEIDILSNSEDTRESALSSSTPITTPNNNNKDLDQKLTRHIHGLLNRLTLSNFSPVMSEILSVFNTNSKNSVTNAILDSLISSITTQVNLMDNFIITFASLSSVMAHLTGIDLIAQIIERCLSIIDPLRKKDKSEREMEMNTDDILITNSKIVMNCVSLFAYLYNLQIISDVFIISLIRESLIGLNDLDVEIILKLIRLSGYQLRKDESANLKLIIGEVLSKVEEMSSSIQSSRFKFMIETIMDLKNNRQKLVVAASAGGELETSKKVIRSFLQANNLSKLESLRITVDDIRNASSKGRWWKIGAKWDPEAGGTTSTSSSSSNISNQKKDLVDNKIIIAAKAHGMNTDVRRSIFGALMTSDDCKDAFNRLSSLGLKSKQEQEIAHVLLHCSNHERLFNPFYSLTALLFIGSKRNFAITFKYAFWDNVKEMELMDNFSGTPKEEERIFRSLIQTARFFSVLLSKRTETETDVREKNYLPISIMKRCNFAKPSEISVSFYQVLICSILEMISADHLLNDIFGELDPSMNVKKIAITNKKLQTISQFEGNSTDDDDFIDIMGDEDSKVNGNNDDFNESYILKMEEMKTLKIGLRLFMKKFILDVPSTSIPTMKNPSLVHRRIGILLEGILSNRNS